MKLTKKGSRYYLVKRVPDRFASIEPRKQVWISLRTDSKREAERRAVEALSDLENQWIAKLNGTYGNTERYHNLIEISEARGLPYLPVVSQSFIGVE
ncbi:DUF6538 domain-containing protein [Lentilitoribacter sp. Alg239-R112]|uniref:DUF6538 domain-containing protein n=1 Tax=Lentilitoribacter sp. Alg239-R112 TaxID=2305987 RepID=UPI0018D64D11|nr:DUF6538 domain-containing protein [Lentilitoribacter sp. Alg239-R112]